jgi:hypothetical protein
MAIRVANTDRRPHLQGFVRFIRMRKQIHDCNTAVNRSVIR